MHNLMRPFLSMPLVTALPCRHKELINLRDVGVPGGGHIPTLHNSHLVAMCNGHLCQIHRPSLSVPEF